MFDKLTLIRLGKASNEFNVGVPAIVDFLHKKGYKIDSNPNTKLSPEMHTLLVREYQPERFVKDASKAIELEYQAAKEKKREEVNIHSGKNVTKHVAISNDSSKTKSENTVTESQLPNDIIIYDIETFPSIIELNGKQTEMMKMSVAVTFDYKDQYKVWFEDDIEELTKYLLKFKRIVGFAIKGFDNIILDQYNDGAKQELDAKSLDLLEIIESRLGHKVNLNNIASPTLKLEKFGDGEKAIEWWLKGEKERVIEYCKDDVRITKELYEYGIANKEIFFNSFGEIRKLSIDWNQEQKYNPADFVYTLTDDESGKEILLDKENKEFFNALELAKTTNRILYITGKAGTGKTTFLKYLKKNINKNTVVLAYTGVAAINAGGQTLNSFFQIDPYDPPFLPDDVKLRLSAPKGDSDQTNIFNYFKYNIAKLELIKSLELLVIDEVSVVRADFIDVIDNILRVYSGKDRDLPFGGVQVIFIGDAFQLPPIEGTEWEILKEFYESPFFFSSRAFQENPPIYIELEKIYRQKESGFINLLNRVRINEPTKEDFILLNRKLRPITNSLFDQNYVVLCSINQQVNEINSSRLNSIQGEELIYEGEIIGDFKASSGVTQKNLALKEGAQIMFLKNGNQFYNGKIGTIEKLTANEIVASTTNNLGIKTKFIVEKATWLNVKYTYNRQKHKIEQEIIGSFTQYPIKLAWAITVHKSQGLTFEKVIINISDFSPSGLVYVALSRCASLDGIILANPILRNSIKTDRRVIEFSKSFNKIDKIKDNCDLDSTIADFLLKKDNDKIGKYHFSLALSYIAKKQFINAYNSLLEGYEYVVCDCYIGDWCNYSFSNKLLSSSSFDCKPFQLDFIRAFVYSYSGNSSEALASINGYIAAKPESEIGYYLKSRILKDGKTEIECLNIALSIKETPRSLYRLGRQTENINLVYKASVSGFQSGCCLGLLAAFSCTNLIKLKDIKLAPIASKFNSYAFGTNPIFIKANFCVYLHKLIESESLLIEDGNNISTIQALEDFANTLVDNKELFLMDTLTNKSKPDIEWVHIPAGTFMMGSPTIETGRRPFEAQHQVTLSGFKISKFVITFNQYDSFCLATDRMKPHDNGWGRGNRPVINVNWNDANAFAEWLGCRLPTEAEWEYACRAGTSSPFYTGNFLKTTQANYDGNYPYNKDEKGESRKMTLPVGSFTPNAWGLFDMHGNVDEWCFDQTEYNVSIPSTASDPKGLRFGSLRIIRGGSWSCNAEFCRSASRSKITPLYVTNRTGFRIVSTN